MYRKSGGSPRSGKRLAVQGASSKRRSKQSRPRGEEWIGLVLGFFLGYFSAEITLAAFMHPLHWVVALAGGAIGYGLVIGWYRWRGLMPWRLRR